jgi:hypothetical protein
MSRSDQDTRLLLTRVMSFTATEDAAPFNAGWPWPDAPQEDQVTDEELAELKARLQTTSAFGQIRTEGHANV